jgi:tRNA(Arg) A34 adenosine deaminase TadA
MARWPALEIALPGWVGEVESGGVEAFPTDEARMRLAVTLARENVLRGTGGPFGAAVFERQSGRLVGVGVNSVIRLNNAVLHAEILAFMVAQARRGSWSLGGGDGGVAHELVTSCEPCAMCLGAVLWSGVTRVVTGAHREDATGLGFDEGPVFPESYRYLAGRGIEITRGVLRDEARGVLELYRRTGGVVYNG